MSIVRIDPTPRYSHAVIHNALVFLAGQVADDLTQDIVGQSKQCLTNIEAALAEVGSHKGGILSAQIWLKDIARDFDGMNRVWDAWTAPGHAPTRATAQCEMADPKILVEIIIIAAQAPV